MSKDNKQLLKEQEVYVPKPIKEAMEKGGCVPATLYYHKKVSTYLEPQSKILISKEELRELLDKTWRAAIEWKKKMLYDGNDESPVLDLHSFINQIIGE